MQPIGILLSSIVALYVSGYIFYKAFLNISPYLFAWLWFNLAIALYEIYIVFHRRELTRKKCTNGFWSRDSNYRGFWKDAWNEYTCYSDERYLDPDNFVFIIEFMNAILVICLLIAFMVQSKAWIYLLLAIQAYHCSIYFISLLHSRKTNTTYPMKTASYLLISALWIFVPIVLIFT